MEDARKQLRRARRVAIKIGSKALTAGTNRFEPLAAQVARLKEDGKDVVLVSSGAIALGIRRLGLAQRPRETPLLQACAAAGQSLLMQMYEGVFAAKGIHVAQVLLTHSDLSDRERYLNARAALTALLDLAVVPIINENDTVAVEEIKFGDNDQLAAMVAALVHADLLIMLSDVDGVLDTEGNRIPIATDVGSLAGVVKKTRNELGTGGMQSKLDAARRALLHGVHVVIADAANVNVIDEIARGRDIGTLFYATSSRLSSRRHWIAYTLRAKGAILVDEGAKKAIATRGKSLLPAGVMGVRGEFDAGDPISICDMTGAEFARGLTRYGTRDVAKLAGARTSEIAPRVGYPGSQEVVHRDDLVLV